MNPPAMDDTSTRKTLDALADLFLTAPETQTNPHQPDAPPEPGNSATIHGRPRPMRLPPKTPVAAVLHGDESPEATDGIPPLTLQLTRPDTDRGDAGTIRLEAVLLGNLPVLGRPWLTQYAHRISQTRGPVIVLHVDSDQIDVELISTTDAPRICDAISSGGPSAKDCEPLAARLRTLTECGADAAKTCLVHLPPPDAGGQPDWMQPLKRWTLLCGADEAAIAATYQLLKKMLEGDADRDERRVGLAVMGSDEDAGQSVTAKLNEAVGRFLKMPVELLCAQKQMVPVRQELIGRFANSPQQRLDLLTFLQRADDAGMLEADAPGHLQPQPEVAGRVDAMSIHTDHNDAPSIDDATVDRAHEPSPDPSAEDPDHTTVSVDTDPDDAAPDLLHLMGATLAGAVALEARCPLQPAMQLILDQSGRLHLLRHQVEHRHEDLRSALIDLIEARAWVRQHLSILSLTMRQYRFDLTLKPAMHLFTGESKVAASLVARIGRYVRFHVLQRIRVGDGHTWVSTDLN